MNETPEPPHKNEQEASKANDKLNAIRRNKEETGTNLNEQYLPDPAEETGNPGDLGGGYDSLGEGQITPPPTENPYWPTPEQRENGKKGISESREILERAKNTDPPPDEDPS